MILYEIYCGDTDWLQRDYETMIISGVDVDSEVAKESQRQLVYSQVDILPERFIHLADEHYWLGSVIAKSCFLGAVE